VSFVVFLAMLRALLPSSSRFIDFNRRGFPGIEMKHVTGKKCNASVACNTLSIQINTFWWLLPHRKCLHLLAKV